MKALATLILTGLLLTGALATGAAAENGPDQPSAIERLDRQEDARRNDPRLGITNIDASSQPTAVERLIRQEDARRNDPALGITRATQVISVPTPPRIEVVTRDTFDWLDAGIGAAAAVGLLVALLGATLAVRAATPRHA